MLSRKLGEKILIGDNITITVVDIDRGKIRLGIDAPRDVPVYRQELLPTHLPAPSRQATHALDAAPDVEGLRAAVLATTTLAELDGVREQIRRALTIAQLDATDLARLVERQKRLLRGDLGGQG